jgi:WD40 repeat protein
VLEEVNGDVQLVKKINLLTNAVKGVSVSGSRVFVVGAASDCAIFNLANFQLEHYKVNLHDKIINDCTSLQENYFASVSRDLSVRIINTDGEVNRITTPHKHSIKCIGASSDGRYVATGSYVGQLGVYDFHEDRWVTFSKVSRFGLSSIQFDDKLQQFVITSYDGKTYSESLGIEHAM